MPDLPANLSQLRRAIIHYAREGVGGTCVWGGTAFRAWDCYLARLVDLRR